MIDVKNIQKVYFIGIGGIGMSALARYFREKGCRVSGYDRAPSVLTHQLEESGITISYSDEVGKEVEEAELIVYTPAIPKQNVIYSYVLNSGRPLLKRSEVLQLILQDMNCIAVAGTHGKTTISSMIAHILRDSGFGCNAFLGGITTNYNTNYWSDSRSLAVVEADEYDRSFLRLSPDIAVLTALDADHLDIYGTVESLQQAFIDFTNKLKKDGLLVYNNSVDRKPAFGGDRQWSYSLRDKNASVYAENISVNEGGYLFDVVICEKETIKGIQLHIGGKYNMENALAAVAVCYDAGVHPEEIKKALATYKGVKRRFEYILKEAHKVYIDDYAHHPEELKMLLTSVKELFPEKACTVIFQPHLFSRTKEMAAEFAKALDIADKVILLPVYPARELPVAGVRSELIAELMSNDKVRCCEKENVFEILAQDTNEVVVTAGAGDIGMMVEDIQTCLINKENVGA